jgi:hypothetical protein
MGPRVYPSQQDTNLTAKGSLILSSSIPNNLEIYVNNTIVNKQFSIINGLYSYAINIGETVTITNPSNISFGVIRKEYTTDDINGNNGIVSTVITGVTNQSSITFIITTTPLSYNFEYLISISQGQTPTPTPLPVKNMTFTCQYDQNVTAYFGSSATFLKSNIGTIGVRKSPSDSFLSPTIPTGQIIFGTGFTSTGVINTIPTNFDISTIDPTTEVVCPFLQCYTGLSSDSYVDYVSHKTEVFIDNVLVDTQIFPLVNSDMVTCGTPDFYYSYFSNLFNNQFGNAMFVKFTDNIEIAGPITARFAPVESGSTYTCYSASTYTFAAKSEDLAVVNFVKSSIINTLPLNGVFWLSKNGKVRQYKRVGGEDYAFALFPVETCREIVNVTIQYRYVGSGGVSGLKTVSDLQGRISDGIDILSFNFSGLTWTTSTDITQSQSVSIYGGSHNFFIRRSICKASGVNTLDNRIRKLFINGVEVSQNINSTNIIMPTCPTVRTDDVFLSNNIINNGDIIQFYSEDDL